MHNEQENHIFNLTGIQISDIANVMKSVINKDKSVKIIKNQLEIWSLFI